MRNLPIGIFDSGIGGLTVFAAIKKLLPDESLLYLGDTARVPYGTKSAATVVRYAREDADFLASRGVKAIVVACNTASAYALPELTRCFSVPVIGVILPGCRQALKITTSRRVGVIGTSGTIASGAYTTCLTSLDPAVRVVDQACPLFVPLAEEGLFLDPATELIAKRYLTPLVAAAVDTLILGCTHYPLLAPLMAKVVGEGVTLVDSGEATATALRQLLSDTNLAAVSGQPRHQLCVTDVPQRFTEVAARFLGGTIPPVEQVVLPHDK